MERMMVISKEFQSHEVLVFGEIYFIFAFVAIY